MRRFNPTLVFLFCAATLASHARAADVYRTDTGPGPADFSGIALGVDGAAGIGDAGGANISGPAAGVHAGYNLQSGGFVGGGEADIMFGRIETGSLGAGSFNQDFLSSARVKGGYAFGPLLGYGTIGAAWSTSAYHDPSGSSDKTLNGLVFGVGAEYALTRTVSLRGEFLRYDFDDATYATPLATKTFAPSTDLLRVGASVHF
jgi:outer membrane immunogenic protein